MASNGFFMEMGGRFNYAALLDWTTALSSEGISVFFAHDRAYFLNLGHARRAAHLADADLTDFVRPKC